MVDSIVPAPIVPAPIVPAPIVPAPIVPAPIVPAPILRQILGHLVYCASAYYVNKTWREILVDILHETDLGDSAIAIQLLSALVLDIHGCRRKYYKEACQRLGGDEIGVKRNAILPATLECSEPGASIPKEFSRKRHIPELMDAHNSAIHGYATITFKVLEPFESFDLRCLGGKLETEREDLDPEASERLADVRAGDTVFAGIEPPPPPPGHELSLEIALLADYSEGWSLDARDALNARRAKHHVSIDAFADLDPDAETEMVAEGIDLDSIDWSGDMSSDWAAGLGTDLSAAGLGTDLSAAGTAGASSERVRYNYDRIEGGFIDPEDPWLPCADIIRDFSEPGAVDTHELMKLLLFSGNLDEASSDSEDDDPALPWRRPGAALALPRAVALPEPDEKI